MSQVLDMDELKRVYTQPSWGYTDQEMGDRFGVDRTAIYKARKRLEDEGIDFDQTDRGRYRIKRETLISNIPVNDTEALILYIATRRLSRNTRLTQKHVRNALEKLGWALCQPMTEKLVKAAAKMDNPPDTDKREKILETLVKAWTKQSKVRVWYKGLRSNDTLAHGVSPYLIEPSPWSDSVYLIGYSDVMEKIVPFKIERIEKAMATSEPPKLQDFNEDELLQYAWGIWRSDQTPELVKLRFRGREAIRRLRESVWHPEEKIETEADGSVIWSAKIAEWQEMLPWIRGWGADCEVLEPVALRETLIGEARRLARLYGWHVSSQQTQTDNSTLDDFFGDTIR